MCTVKSSWWPLQTGYVTNEQVQIAHINQWFRLATVMHLCGKVSQRKFFRDCSQITVYLFVITVMELSSNSRSDEEQILPQTKMMSLWVCPFLYANTATELAQNQAFARFTVTFKLFADVVQRQVLRYSLKFWKALKPCSLAMEETERFKNVAVSQLPKSAEIFFIVERNLETCHKAWELAMVSRILLTA